MTTTNQTQIFKSYSDFLNRPDKTINGVSKDFAKMYPNYIETNLTNKGCWDCVDCTNCHYCSNCTGCTNCHYCSYCTGCYKCEYCNFCNDSVYCDNCVHSKWLQYRIDYKDNRLDKEKYNEAYNDFCDMLDDVYGTINICGYEYTASYILDNIHPRDFDVYLQEYMYELEQEKLETEMQTA